MSIDLRDANAAAFYLEDLVDEFLDGDVKLEALYTAMGTLSALHPASESDELCVAALGAVQAIKRRLRANGGDSLENNLLISKARAYYRVIENGF